MNVHAFFKALSAKCGEGKCEQCGAREFCFTAPHSMTEEIINKALECINDPDGDKL